MNRRCTWFILRRALQRSRRHRRAVRDSDIWYRKASLGHLLRARCWCYPEQSSVAKSVSRESCAVPELVHFSLLTRYYFFIEEA